MLRNMDEKKVLKFSVENNILVPHTSSHFVTQLNLFRSSSSPALAELLGLQDESSYGQLLRTIPRDLKDEWTSTSSWGRQSLLPFALSVSDTTNTEITIFNQSILMCAQLGKMHGIKKNIERQHRTEMLCCWEAKWMNHLQRKQKYQGTGRGNPPQLHSSLVLKGTEDRHIR